MPALDQPATDVSSRLWRAEGFAFMLAAARARPRCNNWIGIPLMPKRDYYDILGLSRGASEQDIKSAFRRLAKDCHPDRNAGDKAPSRSSRS
jgi:DnaJ-domain-containing protein 1